MLRVAEAVHKTHTGRQREANEDSCFERAPVFAVADGMGGAQAGEVASGLAVEAFEAERDDALAPEAYLRETAERANRSIFERARGDSSRSGMGTTLTAAVLADGEVSIGHVGDSRAYLLREGELGQLTNDHSLVEELRRQGKLTREQAAEHPQRSVITRALGPEPGVDVDTMTVSARAGDVFLLCSDGLTTMLDDDRVQAILEEAEDLEQAADHLVRAANDRGGKDNITVVLFRLEDLDGAAGSAEGKTLVGTEAEAEGLTAVAVGQALQQEREQRRPGERGSPRRGDPKATPTASMRRRRAAMIASILAALVALGAAAFFGVRSVWFVGVDESERISLYRGLPYELPFGVELYRERFSSPVTLEALPEARREVAVEHELRSREDAISLIADLQRAAETDAAAGSASGGGGTAREGSSSGGRTTSTTSAPGRTTSTTTEASP